MKPTEKKALLKKCQDAVAHEIILRVCLDNPSGDDRQKLRREWTKARKNATRLKNLVIKAKA